MTDYSKHNRSKVIGCLLSFFLGGFGLHHSYTGNYRLAFIYAFFGAFGISSLIGALETVFMPSRIEKTEVEFDIYKFTLYPLFGVLSFFACLFLLFGSHFAYTTYWSSSKDLAQMRQVDKNFKLVFDDRLTSNVFDNRRNLKNELTNFLSDLVNDRLTSKELYHPRFNHEEFDQYISKFHERLKSHSELELTGITHRDYNNSGISAYVKPKFDQNGEILDPKINLQELIEVKFSNDLINLEITVLKIDDQLYLETISVDGNTLYYIDREKFIYSRKALTPNS